MKYRNAILIVLLVVLADQFLKIYVKTHFRYGEEVSVLGTWFKLHFIENEGMAFGMKFGSAAIAKLILTLFRLAAVVFGFVYLKKIILKGYPTGTIICGALILAGALGNLVDCIFYGQIFSESGFHRASFVPWGHGYSPLFHGKVVDMFYFPLFETTLPDWMPLVGGKHFSFFEEVFNLADAAVCTGTLTLVAFQKRLVHIKAANTAVATK